MFKCEAKEKLIGNINKLRVDQKVIMLGLLDDVLIEWQRKCDEYFEIGAMQEIESLAEIEKMKRDFDKFLDGFKANVNARVSRIMSKEGAEDFAQDLTIAICMDLTRALLNGAIKHAATA